VTVRTPDSGFEALERRHKPMARLVQYILLGVPLIPYVLVQRPAAGALAITAGVAAGAGAWVTWSVIVPPDGVEPP
jgi:hypothetical protein